MLNKEQIMEILPHRPPMLLVDEIVEMDEEHVIGLLHLTGDEFFFQGHFPGNPIMPAVFRLEALAQAGGVALLSMRVQGQDCGLHRHRQGQVPRHGQAWRYAAP